MEIFLDSSDEEGLLMVEMHPDGAILNQSIIRKEAFEL
jgi:hypothetical protein